MTTQALKATLIGDGFAFGMLATVTDQVTYTELLDSVNGLSLFKVAKDRSISKAFGGYVAGSATFRIRNTASNKIKAMWLGSMAKGMGMGLDGVEKFDTPVLIEDNDILEATCNVASA